MSYRGRPSRGCKRCVSKKVKCDQTHPACQRCLKSGQACEYKDEFELIHRNQTKTAEKTAKDKWRQRATKEQSSHSPSSTSSSSPEQIASPIREDGLTSSLATSVQLRPALQQMAYLRFFYDFISAQDYYNVGSTADPIPEMFKKASPNSYFHSAVSAVSLANFGSRFKHEEARQKGQVYYGKALGQFTKAMTGPEEEMDTNEALLGVFLLGIYETLTSTTFDGSYKTHQMGAASILRSRYRNGMLRDALQNRYLAVIYIQVMLHCLTDGVAPPPFDSKWKIWTTDNPRHQLMGLMHRAAIMRYKFRRLSENTGSAAWPFKAPELVADDLNPDKVLEQALELDSRLEEWWQGQQAHFNYQASVEVNPQNRPSWARELFSLPGAPSHMSVFNTALGALGADLYRGTRLYLNLSILRCARQAAVRSPGTDKMSIYHESIVTATASLIIELIDGICMTIPTLLQMTPTGGADDPTTPDEIYGFRALMIFWPLIASSCCLKEEEVMQFDVNLRRMWIPCVYAFLRNNLGLAKAQAFLSDTSSFLPVSFDESLFSNEMMFD
ncbi:hypothetical protein NA57DRAFT_57611 [Rhizodiscina lignyota]|uniref:Zn(2)-C6 fungal-type domain-containing protein n=1 Tax=Rhizodiscina lignyota TaxID=1504668 RepID=A0A9P4M3R6_9PEZI|nr:hypothetical protein NA57DRAFT_57611 [Rhizodiscina lignyota]